MKVNILVFSCLLLNAICLPAQVVQPNEEEKLIAQRFEYIRQIKQYTGGLYWNDLVGNNFPGTIAYFSKSASYFINPQPQMKDKVSSYTVLENQFDWNIWRLRMPYDSAGFVIVTQFQYAPKSKGFINYMTPVLFCSSPEITKKEKPEYTNVQLWSIALMREMFRQYQYSNTAMLTYVIRLNQEHRLLDKDSLQGIFRNNSDFRDTLKTENELLKRALAASSFEEEKKIFTEYLRLRNKRVATYFKQKKFMVNVSEELWEKLEGTAVMQEKIMKENFNKVPVPDFIIKNDPLYDASFTFTDSENTSYSDFRNNANYIDVTGYNMVLLLEKNKVSYKANFFNYASLPLHMQLKYFYKIKS